SIVDVPDVEFNASSPGEGGPPVHLSPTSDARSHLESPTLQRCVAIYLVAKCRPGPHHAHVAAENIPDVWKLVERKATQTPSGTCDARVTAVDGVPGPEILRADHHRPQLHQLEVDTVHPDSDLPVENWAAVLELDRECCES